MRITEKKRTIVMKCTLNSHRGSPIGFELFASLIYFRRLLFFSFVCLFGFCFFFPRNLSTFTQFIVVVCTHHEFNNVFLLQIRIVFLNEWINRFPIFQIMNFDFIHKVAHSIFFCVESISSARSINVNNTFFKTHTQKNYFKLTSEKRASGKKINVKSLFYISNARATHQIMFF